MKRPSINWLRLVTLFAVPCCVMGMFFAPASESFTTKQIASATPIVRSPLAETAEFQVVTDRTTELGAEEMPAYWRLLKEAENTPTEQLQQDSREVEFASLMNTPGEFRGQAVQANLNVRRVLAYEVAGSPLESDELYEIWGWRDGEPNQLYVVVTNELPVGMPVGEVVHERAKVFGYFLKLQGYLPAGAEKRMSPLAAPLVLGHVVRCETPRIAFAHGKDWWRVGLGSVLIVSLVGSFVSRSYLVKPPKVADSHAARDFEDWLAGGDSSTHGTGIPARRE
jgi:hypothetical protein